MKQAVVGGMVIILLASGLACSSAPTVQYAKTGPVKSQGHGPPPHAPAHGYRAKTHDGVELVFRSDLGVYVVVGVSGYYFLDEVFYHREGHGWVTSEHMDGPWQSVSISGVPPGLRSEDKVKGKAKGHSG